MITHWRPDSNAQSVPFLTPSGPIFLGQFPRRPSLPSPIACCILCIGSYPCRGQRGATPGTGDKSVCVGKGPDGTHYSAQLGNGDRVFIEIPLWQLALKQ